MGQAVDANTLRGMLLVTNRAQAAKALSVAGVRGNPSSDCDFCGVIGARWSYSVDEIERSVGHGRNLHVRSVGNWAACEYCQPLIESGDWQGLLSRSLEYLGLAVGANRRIHLTKVLLDFQHMFREGMHGEPVRTH
jgi:hypothetical protein